jgi:hypothetical protein
MINILFLESHVQLADRCETWKFTSGAENLVLQALQFLKVESGANSQAGHFA